MTRIPEHGSPEDIANREDLLALLLEARADPAHPFWTALAEPRNRPHAAVLMGSLLAYRDTPPDTMTMPEDVRAAYLDALERIAREGA